MRYIKVPEPIQIAAPFNAVGEPPYSKPGEHAAFPGLYFAFYEGLRFIVDNAPIFQKPLSMQRAGHRIVVAAEQAHERKSEYIELKDEDHATLDKLVQEAEIPWGTWFRETPSGQVNLNLPGRLFLSFSDAVLQALTDSAYSQIKLE